MMQEISKKPYSEPLENENGDQVISHRFLGSANYQDYVAYNLIEQKNAALASLDFVNLSTGAAADVNEDNMRRAQAAQNKAELNDAARKSLPRAKLF